MQKTNWISLIQAFQLLESIDVAIETGNNILLVLMKPLQVRLVTLNRVLGRYKITREIRIDHFGIWINTVWPEIRCFFLQFIQPRHMSRSWK